MDNKQKLGIAGAGMLAAGIGLSIAGMVCLAPFAISVALRVLQTGSERAIEGIGRVSKLAGTVAGRTEMAVRRAAGAAKSM